MELTMQYQRDSTSSPKSQCQLLQQSLSSYGRELFQTGAFSDCVVNCQGHTWHLHRSILAPRCGFFRACFEAGFGESLPTRCRSLEPTPAYAFAEPAGMFSVNMHDDNPNDLHRMLQWIYTLSYPHGDDLVAYKPSSVQAQAYQLRNADINLHPWTSELSLALIADKYGQLGLVREAGYAVLKRIKSSASDVTSAQHHESFLETVEDFADMLATMFDDAANGTWTSAFTFNFPAEVLRLTGGMISRHIRDEVALKNLVVTVPALTVALIEILSGKPSAINASYEKHDDSETSSDESTKPESNSPRVLHASQDPHPHQFNEHETANQMQFGYLEAMAQNDNVVTRTTQNRIYVPMNEDSDVE